MNFQAFVHPLVWLRLYIVHKLQVCALVWGNICQILWCIPMIGKFTIIYFEEVETVKIPVNTCWQWFLICWAAKPRKLQEHARCMVALYGLYTIVYPEPKWPLWRLTPRVFVQALGMSQQPRVDGECDRGGSEGVHLRVYPPEIQGGNGEIPKKVEVWMGKSTINGGFSIAILVYWRVSLVSHLIPWLWWRSNKWIV
jgi:hypothetical protein